MKIIKYLLLYCERMMFKAQRVLTWRPVICSTTQRFSALCIGSGSIGWVKVKVSQM